MTSVKTIVLTLFSAALLTFASLAYAAESKNSAAKPQVSKEVSEAVDAIAQYSAEQRDTALEKARFVLEELDTRIERQEDWVQDQWGQMTESARQNARTTLKKLRKQRNAVAEWYGGLKHSSGRAWEDVKKGFGAAYADLQDTWNDVEKSFQAAN